MTTEKRTGWIEDKAEWKRLVRHADHIKVGADRTDCDLCVHRTIESDQQALDVARRYYSARGIFD